MSHPLSDALAALLGPDAGVGYAAIEGTHGLLPEEAPAIARAIPKRQAEFAAGRRAARAALTTLGHPAQAIPVGDRRAPIWPQGTVGAITHDQGHADHASRIVNMLDGRVLSENVVGLAAAGEARHA